MALTSRDKMATGGSDVTASATTSHSDNVGRVKPKMNHQQTADTSMTRSASVISAAPPSILSSSSVSAEKGSTNREACGFLMSVGRRNQKPEEGFRPTSTSTPLSRARTVGPMSSRSVPRDPTGRESAVTVSPGVYSADLREAAAADGNTLSPVELPADRSSVISTSAVTRRCDVRSVPGEGPLTTSGLVGSFPGRSSHADASFSTTTKNVQPVQLQTARNTELVIYTPATAVTGGFGASSVTGGSDCSERTATKSSPNSPAATVDSHAVTTSSCHVSTANDAPMSQSLHVNFGSRASASPHQLRRWNAYSESSGSRSSTAVQAASTDHHQQQQQEPERDRKPHSMPCSPRLHARLTATQPWRPWSPSSKSSSGGFVARPFLQSSDNSPATCSVDLSQLASSLLLSKIIRDRQEAELSTDLKSHGNYSK